MKFAIPALAAALALSACAEANAPEADDAAAAGDTTVITPTATETVVAEPDPAVTTPAVTTPAEGTTLTIDGKDVDATVSTDGVDAKIKVD